MRFTVSFQDNVRYSVGEDFVRSASISPDGKRVVFTGSDQVTGEARIYIRNIDSEQATPLPGALEGTEPFWSPDSKSVGFYAGGKVKIAGIESGQVRELANAPATGGASWNDQGQILISLQNPGPLVLIPAAGGTPKPVTLLEPGDLDHDWPQFLDDGVHFLYMVAGRTPLSNKVYLASLASPERTLLLEGIPAFAYASPDRIIYLKNGILVTQVLDVKRAALVGEPVVLAENALPPFSASRTGAMTYRTIPSRPTPLIWIKTDGSVIGDATPPGFFVDPQISPDGKQIAVATRDSPKGNYDVAILDIATRAMRKLTVNPANDRDPVWSPDGKSVVFLSTRPEAPGLYRKNSDGTGAEELVLPSKGTVWAYQWTPGRLSFFDGLSGALDVGFLSGRDLRARTMIVETPFNDVDGAVSPDGRWLAYTSNAHRPLGNVPDIARNARHYTADHQRGRLRSDLESGRDHAVLHALGYFRTDGDPGDARQSADIRHAAPHPPRATGICLRAQRRHRSAWRPTPHRAWLRRAGRSHSARQLAVGEGTVARLPICLSLDRSKGPVPHLHPTGKGMKK